MFCNISCFYFLLVSRLAVIGHSCCGVPANVLFCLFVCLFVFLASLIKIKKNKIQITTATTAVIISIALEKCKKIV